MFNKIKKFFHTKDGIERKEINKQLLITSISVFFTVISVIGVSFAAFVWSDNSEKEHSIAVGNIDLTISSESEPLGSGLNYPVNDADVDSLEPYTFTITNKGSLTANYTLKLVDDTAAIASDGCVSNQIDKSYIYAKLSGANTISNTMLTTFMNNSLDTGVLKPGESKTYNLTLWIHQSAPNSVIGGHFHGKIQLETSQTEQPEETVIYPMIAASDTWYQGTTARSTITAINIVDSADESLIASATESWPAAVDVDEDGTFDDDIMCYINDTTLTIAGNGSGKIMMNPDSSWAFADHTKKDPFSSVSVISNAGQLNTEKVENMQQMLDRTNALTEIDVSDWNVGNVKNFKGFLNTGVSYQTNYKLTTFDVRNWNTSSATDMQHMFYGRNIKNLDVSNWNVTNVRTFDHMFAWSRMSGLDVSKWVTSSAGNMNAMFHTVQNTVLDVSNFDTSNVNTMAQMFEYCSKLTEIIGLENFNTSSCYDFQQMFRDCSNLKVLNLSNWDTRKASANENGPVPNPPHSDGALPCGFIHTFEGLLRIEKIILGENFKFDGDGNMESSDYYAKLPAPNPDYVNTDGYWYNEKGEAFLPEEVPSSTAGTYVIKP